MRFYPLMVTLVSLCGLALSFADAPKPADQPACETKWKKTVIDTKFRSEGVAIADVNKDGKMDIIAGDLWYEAPDWKMHEIRKPKRRDNKEGGEHDPANYSASFCCFVDDFNADGWPDVIVIPFPGEQCNWYENPQGKDQHWKERPVWRSACNETPQYADLFGTGKKVLIMAIQPEGQMCWFSPSKDLDKPWEPRPVSEEKAPGTGRFDHGLGVGDMNGDERLDVLTKHGWWEQPADAQKTDKPWKFRKAALGDDCADMYAFDVDGDGLTDVLSSSAHRRGIWWHQQIASKEAAKDSNTFKKHDIFTDVTQTHAMHFADINGDGKKDIVTGKRWWAHGPKGDDDPNADPCLFWIEIKPNKGAAPEFTVHKIDDQSGVGTQFVVADFNGDGKLDIVVANKKGVFLFEQGK